MNRRQKAILIEIVTILVITIIAIVVMLILRDYVNRREAQMAMTILGNRIRQYRAENGMVPPEHWVDSLRENLPGNARLGKLHYRAMWIDLESDPNEILAYTEQKSRTLFFKDVFLVLILKEVIPPLLPFEDKEVDDSSRQPASVDRSDEPRSELEQDVHIEWMDPQEFKTTLVQQQSQIEIEMQSK